MQRDTEQEIQKGGLSDLISVADDGFSKVIRLSHADESGIVKCYTCDLEMRWQDAQCGHYIKRGNLFLRYDPRNCRVQCKGCNEYLDGNMAEYSRRLEMEQPGITDILRQEAVIVYKPSRDELHAIISESKQKIKIFLKKLP